MEKLIIFVTVFTMFSANCDYFGPYVIQRPEKEVRARYADRFQVYWNVPSMQCKSKGLPFPDLHAKYGILQNKGDRFTGEQITILYDPGKFPALLQNGSSLVYRNGGVPQEGDLRTHLEAFRKSLEKAVPEGFTGVGIIDFESWRPIFRQNFGSLQPYKEVSYDIEAKRHPVWWRQSWIQEAAVNRFEEAGREVMLSTLQLARQLRPDARWGYYAYPYCFNMNPSTKKVQCASNVLEENDRLSWLWSESTSLHPSLYSRSELSSEELQDLVLARVSEAKRVRREADILPYFWYKYRNAGFLSARDIKNTLSTLYKSSAAGVILWGSSNDVNTKAKCQNLLDYVEKILGPAVAKYTKTQRRSKELDDNVGSKDNESEDEEIISTENKKNIEININDFVNRTEAPVFKDIFKETVKEITQDSKETVIDEELSNQQTDSPKIEISPSETTADSTTKGYSSEPLNHRTLENNEKNFDEHPEATENNESTNIQIHDTTNHTTEKVAIFEVIKLLWS